MGINDEIKKSKNRIVRRAYVKRRLVSTGLFEPNWFEISKDIKKWGTIRATTDEVRKNKFKFGTVTMKLANDEGEYNDETNDNSIWFGFASRQRTLVRLEAGFVNQTQGADGIFTRTITPTNGAGTLAAIFTGILQGDLLTNDKNEIPFNVKPLLQIFRDYPARNLTGWDGGAAGTSGGLTASEFIEMLRDQTDGAGSLIFLPFFDNTTTGFVITSTTLNYSILNTSTAEDVRDKNVWQIIEKLAESEQFIPYITKEGIFRFQASSDIATATVFEFHGQGKNNRTFGRTIKKINQFGRRHSKYYSRVELKFNSADTDTSLEIVESSFTVAGNNNPWNFGHRTLQMENLWIPTSTVANSIATTVFNDVSSLNNEIDFSASFVPQLEILDRLSITHDSSPFVAESLWDENEWADSVGAAETGNELIWDKSAGDAISLKDAEFNSLSIEQNLDKMETKVRAKEL